ncbi:hypothetical protein D3C75_1079610 [compost metagenome]
MAFPMKIFMLFVGEAALIRQAIQLVQPVLMLLLVHIIQVRHIGEEITFHDTPLLSS